jgi:phosphoglycolate phosphatase-like HAD superfamily hydrolase/ADP-ribose pyrophosphatase YjhB (NUDIX family)
MRVGGEEHFGGHLSCSGVTLGAVIRNVIFDWSGTLVDDLPAVWTTTNEVLIEFGLPELTLDQFRARFCLPFDTFYQGFAAQIPLAQLEERFHARFPARQDSVTELPHAREFLRFCRRHGLRTFVLSTVIEEFFRVQSKATGFGEYIDHTRLGARDKRLEIGELLSCHGLERKETLFIGDMQHDIETARHGGVRSCAVLTGYNGVDQLRSSAPDLIVEHLGELQLILEQNGLNLHPQPGMARAGSAGLPVVTVGALIYDDEGRVLMVRTRKWSNLWGIPGGKVKYGETLEAALRREIIEETGLELGEIRCVLVQDCIGSEEFYREAHFVLVNYTARRLGANAVRLNDEAQEYRWLPVPEALRLPLNRPTRVLVESLPR